MKDDADVYKELIHAVNRNSYIQSFVVRALYRKEQLKEAEKVPPEWNAYTVLVPNNSDIIDVLSRNPKRSGFVISNIGTGGVYYGGDNFHTSQVTANYDDNGQGVIHAGVLLASSTARIGSSGGLKVSSMGTGATTLQVIETLLLEATRDTSLDSSQFHARFESFNGAGLEKELA